MLISFEGIDGTGKATQASLLESYFNQMGIETAYFDFPAYESFVGKEVGRLLSSDAMDKDVDAQSLPPKIMAMLFALDRMQFSEEIHQALQQGKTVITNRFSLSNCVFQSIRANDDISPWVRQLEHDALHLPVPDYYIVLLGEIHTTRALVESKGSRNYTESHDLYESDDSLLIQSQELYKSLPTPHSKKIIINCISEQKFRAQDEIHKEICAQIESEIQKNIDLESTNSLSRIVATIDQAWRACESNYSIDLHCIQKFLASLPQDQHQNLQHAYKVHGENGKFHDLISKVRKGLSDNEKFDNVDLCIFVALAAYASNPLNDLPYLASDTRGKILKTIYETLHIDNDDVLALDKIWGRLFYS